MLQGAQYTIKPKSKEDYAEVEYRMKTRYSLLTKIIFVIGLIVVLWAGIVFSGILFWGYAYDWALINLDTWLLIDSIIISVLIIIELALYFRYSNFKEKSVEIEKSKPEFIDGKRVTVFTYPQDMEGGIFSKTYVQLDDHNILRLRALMVHPGELWVNKEGKKETEL